MARSKTDENGLTAKQEKFCQAFIETGNASEAYREAYDCTNYKDATIHRSAYALLEKPYVYARLEHLRGIHAQRHNITIDRLTNMYMAGYQLALAINNPSAAATCIMGLGKLHGLMTERGIIEHTGTVTHEHEGISRTAELLQHFIGEGQADSASRPVSH